MAATPRRWGGAGGCAGASRRMTLIISCLTADCVYQVSDRRVTDLGGPTPGRVRSDEINKAVLLRQSMAFGYTGLAQIENTPTDRWLADIAVEQMQHGLQRVVTEVQRRATVAFQAMPWDPTYRRHAFVGVGWATHGSAPNRLPTIVTISNALGPDGRWRARPADEFAVEATVGLPAGRPFLIRPAGAELRRDERRLLEREVSRCVKRGAPAGAFLYTLAMAIGRVHHRVQGVGQHLMALCIPRAAVERPRQLVVDGIPGTLVLSGMPTEHTSDMVTFAYMRPGEATGVWYSPLIVWPGGIVEMWSGPLGTSRHR